MPAKWKMLKIKSLWQKRLAEFYTQIPFSWGLGWLWATNTVWNFGRTQWEDLPLYKIHTLQGHCTTSCLLSTRRYCCLLGQPTIANVLAPGEITWFSIGKWKVLEVLCKACSLSSPASNRGQCTNAAPLPGSLKWPRHTPLSHQPNSRKCSVQEAHKILMQSHHIKNGLAEKSEG